MLEYFKKNSITIITTILSIVVTIIVGWYTIQFGESRKREAIMERELKVKNELVSLVEQNIINKTPLETIRLSRIIEAKKSEESVDFELSPIQLIKLSELNLLTSNHLSSEQKVMYKQLYDSIYSRFIPNVESIATDSTVVNNPDLVRHLIEQINNGQNSAATQSLTVLLNEYNQEIERLKSFKLTNRYDESSLFSLGENIPILIAFTILYFYFLWFINNGRKAISDPKFYKLTYFVVLISLMAVMFVFAYPAFRSIIVKSF